MRVARRGTLGLAFVITSVGCGLGFADLDIPESTVDASVEPRPGVDAAPTATASAPDASADDAAPDTGVDSGPPLSCFDRMKSGDETDVDCGGSCKPCAVDKTCATSLDCDKSICNAAKTCELAISCKDLLAAHPGIDSGVYELSNAGRNAKYEAGCEMRWDGGGYTLVMKIDGSKNTFDYESALWTMSVFLAEDHPRIDDKVEAKFQAYHEVPLGEVALAFDSNGIKRLKVPAPASVSLATIIAKGATTATSLGATSWRGLVNSPSLQNDCNPEGYSVDRNGAKVRIGILGDDRTSCENPDSFIGVGSSSFCLRGPRAGNVACFNGIGNDRTTDVFAWVYVR